MRLKVRASSLPTYADCPSRWASIHIDGVHTVTSGPAWIGTSVHASTAVFDREKQTQSPCTPADAADVLVETLKNPTQEVDWGKLTYKEALQRALGVHSRYCTNISPQFEFAEIEKTLDSMEIEVDVDGYIVTIELTGTLDRIYRVLKLDNSMGFGVADVKTGARAVSDGTGKHKYQIGAYELLAAETLGYDINLPGRILQLQTSTNYRVGIGKVDQARRALIGTEECPGILYHIARMAKTGHFFGNPMSFLCAQKFCPNYGPCIWR